MAIDDLDRNPPRWILHLDLKREEFLRVFPNATKLNHKFEAMERWIAGNYQFVDGVPAAAGYRLMERRSDVTPASSQRTAPPATRRNSPAGP